MPPKTAVARASGRVSPTEKQLERKVVEKETTQKVLYPDIEVCGIKIPRDRMVIKVERAKEILGWQEETASVKFGADFDILDYYGNKIRLTRNKGNRNWTEGWSKQLGQVVLSGHWRLNGETIIIGCFGSSLSAQHRLIGLVIAHQMWSSDTEEGKHWRRICPDEPCLLSLWVTGIDESFDTVRTLDNVRPRTYADVLFCDHGFFNDLSDSKRQVVATVAQRVVKFLWERTGMEDDPFTPKLTIPEGMDFLTNHQHVKESLRHIWDENEDNRIGDIIGLGNAVMALYMMGCSATTVEQAKEYLEAKTRSERNLDFSRWDKACEFWVGLGAGSPDFAPVHEALAALHHPDTGEGATNVEKLLVIQRAWDLFVSGKTLAFLELSDDDYIWDEIGEAKTKIKVDLKHRAVFGHIDVKFAKKKDGDQQYNPPTPTEIKEAAAEIKRENLEKVKESKPERKTKTKEVAKQLTAETMVDKLRKLRDNHADSILLFKANDWYTVWAKDATAVASLVKSKTSPGEKGLVKFEFTEKDYDRVLSLLKSDGRAVATVDGESVKYVVRPTTGKKKG